MLMTAMWVFLLVFYASGPFIGGGHPFCGQPADTSRAVCRLPASKISGSLSSLPQKAEQCNRFLRISRQKVSFWAAF